MAWTPCYIQLLVVPRCWRRGFSDAQVCTTVQPDLEKGYDRHRMVFHLLQDYASASNALLKTSWLDPENAGINSALWIKDTHIPWMIVLRILLTLLNLFLRFSIRKATW